MFLRVEFPCILQRLSLDERCGLPFIEPDKAAEVVGEKTCGKGNFQTGFQLSDGSLLNISIGKYYTPQGRSLTDLGVTPDVEIEYDDETYAKLYYSQLEDADDTQLQAALRILTDKIS